jgi:hypothetical protein
VEDIRQIGQCDIINLKMIRKINLNINNMSIYILNNNNYDWEYIPKNGNINSQIILKKVVNNDIYIYNFNGDIYDEYIGEISSFTNFFQINEDNKYYKRVIINPYNEIHIIETVEQNDKTNNREETRSNEP